jgi:hypothetical protein
MADDPAFGKPYIDVDEMRQVPRPHRYVHGGFENTHTRFSFYMPPPELYKGRFVQYLEGGAGGNENLLETSWQILGAGPWQYDLAFDELGGYLVESNQGHFPGEGLGIENDLENFGASAQTARFSKKVAAEMYGYEPHHGYVWGQSGGGIRSAACLENVSDVWAGGVPEVGTGVSTFPVWSAQANAAEVLRGEKLRRVVDALEPGGSGNPYEHLTDDEADALATLFRFGFERKMVSQLGRFPAWAFTVHIMNDLDPEYVDDFWSKPGYLGYELPESLARRLVDEKTTVTRVLEADDLGTGGIGALRMATAGASLPSGFAVDVDLPDTDRLFMSKLTVTTGKAKGREMLIWSVDDGHLVPFSERCPEMFDGVLPGDEVSIDNRSYLAFCYYHRHLIGGSQPELTGARGLLPEHEHLAVDGVPLYPQRYNAAMVEPNHLSHRGRFHGKMIMVMCTHDIMVPHAAGVTYARLAQHYQGDQMDEKYRIWWAENATHALPSFVAPITSETEKDPNVWNSRLIDYDSLTAQALRDVVAWAEDGVPPPASTAWELNRDAGLVLGATAAERGGIQPVAAAEVAGGGQRAEVKVGEPVTIEAVATVPPGTGTIVRAQWDLLGINEFGESAAEADGTSESIRVSVTHAYSEPGTYFPCFRVGSHRFGAAGKGDPVWNNARVRVVVHP